MGIGMRIKQARERLNLTQKQLANLLGVTASAVTNYENEISHPKEPVMYKLLNVLSVDANFLFQDQMNEYPKKMSFMDPLERELLHNFLALNEEGRERLLNYSQDLVESGRYKKHLKYDMVKGA